MKRWQEHYEKELNEDQLQYSTLSPAGYKIDGTPITITIEMVDKALKTMKNGKANGPEGTPIELKHGPVKHAC